MWGGSWRAAGRRISTSRSAPTPHPLGTLLGVLLAPLGAAAGDAAILLVLASLAAAVWLASRLAASGSAARRADRCRVVLTRVPVLTPAARAYVDVPYLALVLGAVLVEARRRRAGAPVLALLALAGLLRPEAWLFSAAYLVWVVRGRPRAEAVRLGALAAAAPAAWLLGDLVLAGDPLHSFTWTREQASALGRARGPGALRTALPDKLAHAVGRPVLVAGTARAGTAAASATPRRRGRAAAATLGASLATAGGLTAAGIP